MQEGVRRRRSALSLAGLGGRAGHTQYHGAFERVIINTSLFIGVLGSLLKIFGVLESAYVSLAKAIFGSLVAIVVSRPVKYLSFLYMAIGTKGFRRNHKRVAELCTIEVFQSCSAPKTVK